MLICQWFAVSNVQKHTHLFEFLTISVMNYFSIGNGLAAFSVLIFYVADMAQKAFQSILVVMEAAALSLVC